MHQKDSKKPQYNTTGKTNRIMDRLQGSLILKFIKASAHQQKFADTNDNTASQYMVYKQRQFRHQRTQTRLHWRTPRTTRLVNPETEADPWPGAYWPPRRRSTK